MAKIEITSPYPTQSIYPTNALPSMACRMREKEKIPMRGDAIDNHLGPSDTQKIFQKAHPSPKKRGRPRKGKKLRDRLTKEKLEYLYGKEMLSTREIGKRYGVSKTTVLNLLENYGIKKRSRMRDITDKEILERLYVTEGRGSIEIARMLGVSKPSILKWLKEFEIPIRPNAKSHVNVKTGEDSPYWRQITVPCSNCGKPIKRMPYRVRDFKHQFCSKKCNREWRKSIRGEGHPLYKRVTKICLQCGNEFEVHNFRKDSARCCSKDCAGEYYSKNYRGEKRYNWKGGPIRYGLDWGRQQRRARKRDKGICYMCSANEKDFDYKFPIHHIVPYRISHNNSLENLMTLCRKCHTRIESITEDN